MTPNLSKHLPVHLLLFVLVGLDSFLQFNNLFLDTIIIGLQLLNSYQVLQGKVKVLFALLSLSSSISCFGDPVRSIIKLLLRK